MGLDWFRDTRPEVLPDPGRDRSAGLQLVEPVQRALDSVRQFLQCLPQTAGRFTLTERWRWCLRLIFRDWIKTKNSDPVFLPLSTLVNCRILDDR